MAAPIRRDGGPAEISAHDRWLAAGDAGLQVDHPGIGCGVAGHVSASPQGPAQAGRGIRPLARSARRTPARVTGSFTRPVTLPEGADTGHITAGYDKGML